MADLEILNSQQHGDLRLSRAIDSQRHFAQIVAEEFVPAAAHFPILFTKRPDTGAFYAGVIMGLEPGTNLLARNGVLPDYRPADLERQGFFIDGDNVLIDRAHIAFASGRGDGLFDDDGEAAAPALRRVQAALRTLHQGIPATDAAIARLLRHRLLEPIDVTLNFDDGVPIRLDGLYTVSLDAVQALPDAAALELFRAGDLQLAYVQAASVRHLRTLARIRNDALTGPLA